MAAPSRGGGVELLANVVVGDGPINLGVHTKDEDRTPALRGRCRITPALELRCLRCEAQVGN
jgi:hypothetical protein